MVVAIVIVVGAAAMTMNGYSSVYASSSGTSGSAFNSGNSHLHCTAAASESTLGCPTTTTDNGQHTGLTNWGHIFYSFLDDIFNIVELKKCNVDIRIDR